MVDDDELALLAKQDWPELIEALTAYAVARARRYRWAKGDLNLPDGEDPSDVVEHVITKLYTGEHAWNRVKHPRLLDHLQNRVDSRLHALVRSRANSRMSAKSDEADLEAFGASTDPRDDSAAEQEATIEAYLRKAVRGEQELQEVVDLLMEGRKPREIADGLGVPVEEVYRREQKLMRRLRRIHQKEGPNLGS